MRGKAKLAGAAGLLAAAGLVLGCSSASSSSGSSGSGSPGSSATATGMSGTETFSGVEQLTRAQADSNSYVPVIGLHATGVFTDTGSITLTPGSGKNGNGPGPAVIKLSKGWINVTHGATPDTQPSLLPGACAYGATVRVSYTVTSGTKAYAGATGHGTATVQERFDLPRLASGACDTAKSAQPTGGSVTFTAVGPVVIP